MSTMPSMALRKTENTAVNNGLFWRDHERKDL